MLAAASRGTRVEPEIMAAAALLSGTRRFAFIDCGRQTVEDIVSDWRLTSFLVRLHHAEKDGRR